MNSGDPNTTSLVIQQAIDLAKGFLLEIVRPPAKEVGELLADQVRSFRFNNQIRILTKARERLETAGVSPNKVSLKLLIPLLDSGSWEEEESMIDRWANLLANAANPSYKHDIQMGYVEVLEQLSPIEAVILDKLYDHYSEVLAEGTRTEEGFHVRLEGAKLKGMTDLKQEEFERAMDNLFRLNLSTTSGALLRNPQPGEDFYSRDANIDIEFTRFGYGFTAACRTGD